ncbi:MAG: FAD:protein FMN transferase [Clostridia bacterium]
MKKTVIVILILFIFIFSACTKELVHHNKNFMAMSTVVTYQAYAEEGINVNSIIKEAILGTEKLMSRTDSESEIYKINELAGSDKKVEVSEDVKEIIETSLMYQNLTNNSFRITIYPLVVLWDIMNPDAPIPTDEEIEQAKQLSDTNNLRYNKDEGTLAMIEKGSGIDLGGIAKGFAVDQAVEELKDRGVSHGFISIGGGVQAFGGKESGDPWVLGLQNPITPQKGHFATYATQDGAVVTSGDYQRRKVQDEVVYHHIIDPETGYPVQQGLAAVTIFTDNSTDADAYSTAVYIMGFEKGLDFVNEREEVEAMFVFHDKTVYATDGVKDKINVVDSEFYFDENR